MARRTSVFAPISDFFIGVPITGTPSRKLRTLSVGHQCYTHKLLTGRRKQFDHLRQLDGISGFPNPNESVHDAFIAGHGNTALSLAIGMAWAKKIKHEPGLVVALIGDGAFTGGMVYEGMNNIGGLDNLLVILNDNIFTRPLCVCTLGVSSVFYTTGNKKPTREPSSTPATTCSGVWPTISFRCIFCKKGAFFSLTSIHWAII